MQLLADTQPGERESARAKLIDILTHQSRLGKPEERNAASDALINLYATNAAATRWTPSMPK